MARIDITTACALLCSNQVVALPTETVYGLAGDASSSVACQSIYCVKGRPSSNPLIVHGADVTSFSREVQWTPLAQQFAEQFWPGPLTLILPSNHTLAAEVYAGYHTVAIRVPAHPVFQTILKETELLLAAPSANLTNRISPTSAEQVLYQIPELPTVDGGACTVGVESTILDLTLGIPTILRPGRLSAEDLSVITEVVYGKEKYAPGQHKAHYQPRTQAYLNADITPTSNDFVIGFGNAWCHFNLSAAGDYVEALRNLYTALYTADISGAQRILIQIPLLSSGPSMALTDRLIRATYKNLKKV
jgi:L-threonylcarbamoyladenylate synthase